MTNGEKIKQAFPDLQIDIGELEVYMWTTAHDAIDIPLDWWNAEYKDPQTFKWCADCKEYDQEKHCCHKYSKVIRDTVAEIRQEPVLDKISKMKSEIADSLEFWDYSPNNNPLARDMLETLTNFWGDIKAETEDKE